MNAAAAPRFVAEAEAFASLWGDDPAFRLLGRLLRCSAGELDLVVKKVHSMSVAENTHEPREPLARAYAGLFLLSFALFARCRVFWRAAPRADWCLEASSPDHFKMMFGEVFAALPGAKRIAPRSPGDYGGAATTDGTLSTASLGDLARLALAAPLAAALVWSLSRRSGVPLAQAWRKAASIYVSSRGYFRRYPCATFVTHAEELNHPARHLAFRQAGGETLAVVQNGERSVHPSFAFGSVDLYMVFGPRYEEILRSVGARARSFVPVGAFCLNENHARLAPLVERPAPAEYDVLFFDQSFSHNGLLPGTNRSLERIVENLGRLQAERGLKVAYQLRPYGPDHASPRRDAVETVRRLLPRADVLENSPPGQGYVNALRARLLMTFQSTIGFEMMRLGRKVLFVNYSGDATETTCRDERFLLEDPEGDYARFAAKVDRLLSWEMDGVPAEAMERHPWFDGRVQDRIARALLGR